MKPRTKVALPAFCAMGFSLSLFLTIGALYAKQQVQRQVARQIPGNGRICAQAANEVFTTQEEDLEALSTVPANTGIAGCCSSGSRTEAPGGVSLEHWCLQFEQDLASRITNGTGCTQEGFLLTSSSWTGLVRVDARKGAARAVPAYTLQARSGEPGFQNIAQRAGGSIICISRLPPDREHGKVSGPPAIRAVHPAQNTAGGVCGANAAGTSDVALLTHTRPKITPDYSVNAISEKQAGNGGSAAAPAIQLHSRPARLRLLLQEIMGAPAGSLQPYRDKHRGKTGDSVWVDAMNHKRMLQLVACNDSLGIPEQCHGRIFEIPQSPLPRDRTERGIGLAIAATRTDATGGEITVQSDGTSEASLRFPWPRQLQKKEMAA